MEMKKRNINGLLGTLIFHGALVIILLIFSFTPAPYEYPEPEGIVIDFGQMVQGEDVQVESSTEQSEQTPTEQSQSSASPEPEVVTQTNVDAPSVTDTENPDPSPENEITPDERERIEREQREQEERERIDAMFRDRFGDNPGNSDVGDESGDPGDPRATSVGDKKGSPGNPYGNKDVTSWSKLINTQNCNKSIQLTVRLDNLGNVLSITKIETALSEQACIEAAKKAAMKVKFPSDRASTNPRYAVVTYDYTISSR